MKVQKTLQAAFAILLVSFFFASKAGAHGFWGKRHKGGWFGSPSPDERADRMVEEIADELDLDDSQTALLNRIKDEMMAKRQEMKGDKEMFQKALLEETKSESFDKARIQGLVDAHIVKARETAPFFLQKIVELHAALTPEQRQLVVEHIKEKKEKSTSRKRRWFYKTPEERADIVLEMVAYRLDLDDAQSETFFAVKDEIMAKFKLLFSEKEKEEMFEAAVAEVGADNLDQARIQAMFDAKLPKVKEMADFLVAKYAELHAVLNQEQRETIVEHMEKRHGRR